LNFTLSKPAKWIGYSLDGGDNVTVTGNTTINGLAAGLHNITLYATSQTVTFKLSEPEPFPVAFVSGVLGISATIIVVCFLLVKAKVRVREKLERND
jgi:hypothetical protein